MAVKDLFAPVMVDWRVLVRIVIRTGWMRRI